MLGAAAAVGAWWLWHRGEVAPGRARAAALAERRSRVPARLEARLAPAVARIAPGHTVEWALAWWGILGALALLVGVEIGPVGIGLALIGTAAIGPVAHVTAGRRAAVARRAALPEFVHGVAGALRAGSSLVTALTAGVVPAALADDLAAVRARIVAGCPVVDALAAWADAAGDAATRAVAGALAVVHLEGGAAAGPLDGLADALRARESVVREAAALATQARLSAVVILLAPIAFVLVGGVAAPEQIAHLTATWAGRGCLAAGLGLDVIGALWMRRIVAGVA
jgi:tight adherence protein B